MNRQTEWQNQTMKVYLQMYCNKTQNNWMKLLFMNEFSYNNSKHTVIQMISFYANKKWNSKLNFNVSMKMSKIFREMNQNKKIKNLNEILKTCLQNISWQYADYYDFKWKFMTYNVENKV